MAKKIFIVDDSVFICKTLQDILTSGGYEVVGDANNGQQALLKFKELTPDLVILDLMIPGENGLDILVGLIKENPKVRILVLTAVVNQAVIVEVVQAGAKGFLNKPFQAKSLLAEVKRILAD